MDCRRELVFRSKSITDRHRNVAVLGQPNAKPIIALTVAGTEAATVNARNRRERTIAGLGPGHIELKVLAVWIGVFNVWLEDDVLRHGDLLWLLGFGQVRRQRENCRRDEKKHGKTMPWLNHVRRSCPMNDAHGVLLVHVC